MNMSNRNSQPSSFLTMLKTIFFCCTIALCSSSYVYGTDKNSTNEDEKIQQLLANYQQIIQNKIQIVLQLQLKKIDLLKVQTDQHCDLDSQNKEANLQCMLNVILNNNYKPQQLQQATDLVKRLIQISNIIEQSNNVNAIYVCNKKVKLLTKINDSNKTNKSLFNSIFVPWSQLCLECLKNRKLSTTVLTHYYTMLEYIDNNIINKLNSAITAKECPEPQQLREIFYLICDKKLYNKQSILIQGKVNGIAEKIIEILKQVDAKIITVNDDQLNWLQVMLLMLQTSATNIQKSPVYIQLLSRGLDSSMNFLADASVGKKILTNGVFKSVLNIEELDDIDRNCETITVMHIIFLYISHLLTKVVNCLKKHFETDTQTQHDIDIVSAAYVFWEKLIEIDSCRSLNRDRSLLNIIYKQIVDILFYEWPNATRIMNKIECISALVNNVEQLDVSNKYDMCDRITSYRGDGGTVIRMSGHYLQQHINETIGG